MHCRSARFAETYVRFGLGTRGERFLSDCYDYNTALTWGLSEAAYNIWEERDYTRRMQYDRFSRE